MTAVGSSDGYNGVIVKYNSSGVPQWAHSVSTLPGSGGSLFKAVSTDNLGNVLVTGYQENTNTYNFGAGASTTGSSIIQNILVVKYNSTGTAQWADSVTGEIQASTGNAIATDTSNNVFVAGNWAGQGVLMKYTPAGNSVWMQKVTSSSGNSSFEGIQVDGLGNPYCVGYQSSMNTFVYGNAVSLTSNNMYRNLVIAKFSNTGSVQWARSITSGSNSSEYRSVDIDIAGNIYAVGYQTGTSVYTYASGKSVAGTSTGSNIVIAKYLE